MADYHVGCGITGIFAGTLNKTNTMWVNKSDVTDEAIKSVAQFLLEHEEAMEFNYQGKHYRLVVTQAEAESLESEDGMNGAICYCGAKMDIDKMLESGGMDGSYRNWTLRCPRCGIVKKYAADGFYGREYFSTIEDVINEWNRNKAMSYRLSANTEVSKWT